MAATAASPPSTDRKKPESRVLSTAAQQAQAVQLYLLGAEISRVQCQASAAETEEAGVGSL